MKKRIQLRKKASSEIIAQALLQNHGNLNATANFLNMTRQNLVKHIEENPQIKELQETILEIKLDIAEEALLDLIKEKNFQAIKYYLSKKGQNRGYQETKTIEKSFYNGIVIIPETQSTEEWEKKAKQIQELTPKQLKSAN